MLEFNSSSMKSEITLWIHNIMINRPTEFSSYENLEAHIRNHMINETTKFISCNRKELEGIYNHHKEQLKNVS